MRRRRGSVPARAFNDELRIQANLADQGSVSAEADVVLPVEASAAPLRLAIARTRTMSGTVAAQGQIQPIWDLFFGGEPGQPMPDVAAEKASVSPIKRGEDGKKKVRQHYRDVPRRKFAGPLDTGELLDALFGKEA